MVGPLFERPVLFASACSATCWRYQYPPNRFRTFSWTAEFGFVAVGICFAYGPAAPIVNAAEGLD
jgi:hypothetical protein